MIIMIIIIIIIMIIIKAVKCKITIIIIYELTCCYFFSEIIYVLSVLLPVEAEDLALSEAWHPVPPLCSSLSLCTQQLDPVAPPGSSRQH